MCMLRRMRALFHFWLTLISSSQGDRHVWYVGAYVPAHALPLLEAGVTSAIAVASALGADASIISRDARAPRLGGGSSYYPAVARWFAIAMVVAAMACHVEALWVLA